MLIYLLIGALIFLILWCSVKREPECLPQLSPKKVFPGGFGSPHLSTMSTEPVVERDYTYLFTKIDKSILRSKMFQSSERTLETAGLLWNKKSDLPICDPPISSPEYNKSYIANHTLGPLVPGKPSDYQTDCYQYICPADLPEGSICWRCGK